MPVLETLGFAVGVAALFSTVLDVFDFVIKAKKLTVDFTTLNSLLNTHKLRFYIFGLTYGLVSGADGEPAQPDPRLELPDIGHVVRDNVDSIFMLLQEAQVIVETYNKVDAVPAGDRERGLRQALAKTWRRQRDRRYGLSATKWSAHHGERFATIISRIGDLIEGLYQVTEALDLLERHRRVLEREVSNTTDAESIRLIRDTFSSRDDSVSTSARMRLNELGIAGEATSSHMSYVTAESAVRGIEDHLAAENEGLSEDADGNHHMSQNKRIMADLIASTGAAPDDRLALTTNDASYGDSLRPIREDEAWRTQYLSSAKYSRLQTRQYDTRFAPKCILRQVRDCMLTDTPGISIVPVRDNFRHLLGKYHYSNIFLIRISGR